VEVVKAAIDNCPVGRQRQVVLPPALKANRR